MGQKRRSTSQANLTATATGRRLQQLATVPSDIVKNELLRQLLEQRTFLPDEIVTPNFMTPHTLATLTDAWETGVPGAAGPVATYVMDLDGIGFTAHATFPAGVILHFYMTNTGGRTYQVSVSASDVFSVAVAGGAAMVLGACTIARGTGDLSIVTAGGTDDLTPGGDDWTMTAFVLENEDTVRGVAPHGAGWGEADFLPRTGMVEMRHKDAAGGDVATVGGASIILQSPFVAGTFGAGIGQAVFLISPVDHILNFASISYHIGIDAEDVAAYADPGWLAWPWDGGTDLVGDPMLYRTTALGGGTFNAAIIVTLRIELSFAPARTEGTFVYGYGFGVKA